MGLLLVFMLSIVVGQALAIFAGLVVERHTSSYTGLITFIVLYFLMFWVCWKFAVRVTEPGTRLGAWLGGDARK